MRPLSDSWIIFQSAHHCAEPFEVYGMCISAFSQGAASLCWTAALGGSSTSAPQMIKAVVFCLLACMGGSSWQTQPLCSLPLQEKCKQILR